MILLGLKASNLGGLEVLKVEEVEIFNVTVCKLLL